MKNKDKAAPLPAPGSRKPYSRASDVRKVQINWHSSCLSYINHEYSMAIVRSAVCIELAATLAIRIELIKNRRLEPQFVDHLLRWANGLNGKFEKILYPLLDGTPRGANLRSLAKVWRKVSAERNAIAHSGHFKKASTARHHLDLAYAVITGIASEYHVDLKILPPGEVDDIVK